MRARHQRQATMGRGDFVQRVVKFGERRVAFEQAGFGGIGADQRLVSVPLKR